MQFTIGMKFKQQRPKYVLQINVLMTLTYKYYL